jgi:hypothetical protein
MGFKVGVIMMEGMQVGDITIDEEASGTGTGVTPVSLQGGSPSDFPGVPGIGGRGAPRLGRGGGGRGRGGGGGGGGGDGEPRHYEPEWVPADPRFRRKVPGKHPDEPGRKAPEQHPEPGSYQSRGTEDSPKPRPRDTEDPPKPRDDGPAPDGSSESEGAYEGIRQGPGDMHEAWSEGLQPERQRPSPVEDPPKPKTDEEREAQREAHRGVRREVEAKPAGAMPAPKGWAPPKYTNVIAPGGGVGEDATAAALPVQPEGDPAPRMGIAGPGDLNRQAFDQMFNDTPMAGKFDRVTELSKQHGIPPALFGAIIAHETGKGTSAALRDKNNPAGISGSGSPWTFPNLDAGLVKSAESIAKNWRNAHENIGELAEIYAPTKGATNDPGNLNKDWPAGVRRYMSQLGIPGKAGPIATYDMPSGFGPTTGSEASSIPYARVASGSRLSPEVHEYERRMGEPGEFNATEFGPPGQNITSITLSNGQTLNVNAAVADRFLGFANEMLARGFPLTTAGGGGGYNYRSKRGSSGLSIHSYGTAVDFNVPENAFGGRTTNFPEETEKIAWKHGLSWGARFGDPMHFEAMGERAVQSKLEQLRQSGYAQQAAPAAPTRVAEDLESIDSLLDRVYGPKK